MQKIAILDSCSDGMLALGHLLRQKGFEPVMASLGEVTSRRLDLRAFLEEHDPRVVIFDIPYPYRDHCRFLDEKLEEGLFRDREVVLTTTNLSVVKELEGCRKVHLLMGKPYSFDELLGAIQHAV